MNIKLNLQGAKKAASGLPWVRVKDLEHFKQLPQAGEVVRLQDSMGNFLAHAVSDGPGSAVPYRILSRLRHPEFDAPYFEAMVEAAIGLRRPLLSEDAGVRLVHGEADGLPGVFCERHGPALFIECLSPGMRAFLPLVEAALLRQSGAGSLYHKGPEGWNLVQGAPAAPPKSKVAGMAFRLRLEQDEPGDFRLESRLDYARLAELGLKGTALIAFSRKGAWAAAALRAGCSRAVCLERDSSLNAMAMENMKLNALSDRAEFPGGDAMERLEKLSAKGERFGFIMADLPRKSAGARLKFQARRDAAGLMAKVLGLLDEGGVAAFSLAASELSQEGFSGALARGVKGSGIAAETAAAGRLAPDFPQIPGFEEASQRRFLALRRAALS